MRTTTKHKGKKFKLLEKSSDGSTWYSLIRLSDGAEIANVSYDGCMGVRHPFALTASELEDIAPMLAAMQRARPKSKRLVDVQYDTGIDDPGVISIGDLRKKLSRIAKDNSGEATLLHWDAGANNISCTVVKEEYI